MTEKTERIMARYGVVSDCTNTRNFATALKLFRRERVQNVISLWQEGFDVWSLSDNKSLLNGDILEVSSNGTSGNNKSHRMVFLKEEEIDFARDNGVEDVLKKFGGVEDAIAISYHSIRMMMGKNGRLLRRELSERGINRFLSVHRKDLSNDPFVRHSNYTSSKGKSLFCEVGLLDDGRYGILNLYGDGDVSYNGFLLGATGILR